MEAVLADAFRHVPCAAPGVWAYDSIAQGASYLLNTNLVKQGDAEQYCRDNGGHLVVYASR